MKFSSRSTEDDSPIVELTPLIDVVFLLLIFFMVSSTFKDEARLAVDLPESSAETSDQPPQSLEVVLTADGRYFINGEPLNDADAESAELSVGVSIDLLKQHLFHHWHSRAVTTGCGERLQRTRLGVGWGSVSSV